MKSLRPCFALAFSLSLSCTDTPPDPPSPADQDLRAPLTPDDRKDAICLKMDSITLQPGQEVTKCLTAHLPTTTPVDVVRIETRQISTHHVIFYREQKDLPDEGTHDCRPLDIFNGVMIQRVPLFIGETPDAELKMPPGVAYPFAPGAAYTIEGHYINASAKEVTTSAEVCLHTAPMGTQTIKADMIFYASVSGLNQKYDGMKAGLPPGRSTTITPPGFHEPKAGIKLFGLTSHQHRMGTDFVITKSTSRESPGQMLYRNQDWEHPPLLRFPDDQLLTFDESKGEGLRWECSYNNKNDYYLTFGQSAVRNEMCILWGYYYPSKGFDIYFE